MVNRVHKVSLMIGTDKTMKEVYLPSFAETVRAGTGAVMWYVDRERECRS